MIVYNISPFPRDHTQNGMYPVIIQVSGFSDGLMLVSTAVVRLTIRGPKHY